MAHVHDGNVLSSATVGLEKQEMMAFKRVCTRTNKVL